MREIDKIILHCSATWSKQDIGAAEIKRWHTLPKSKGGRGWTDIGYHYVIRRSGEVEPGRPLEMSGAHCTGHNAHSIGVCLVGGGPNGEDHSFTSEQFDALAELILDLRKRFPNASIHGHNEFANKACPVFSVSHFLFLYGISKYPWDLERGPHFRPSEFTGSGCPALWGNGPMPEVWERTLDALEALRGMYGKPMILTRTEWQKEIQVLICDIKMPLNDRAAYTRKAIAAGFTSARVLATGIRVYKDMS